MPSKRQILESAWKFVLSTIKLTQDTLRCGHPFDPFSALVDLVLVDVMWSPNFNAAFFSIPPSQKIALCFPLVTTSMLDAVCESGKFKESIEALRVGEVRVHWNDDKGRYRTGDNNYHRAVLSGNENIFYTNGTCKTMNVGELKGICTCVKPTTALALSLYTKGELKRFTNIYLETHRDFLNDLEKLGGGFSDAYSLWFVLLTVIEKQLTIDSVTVTSVPTAVEAVKAAVNNFLAYHDSFRKWKDRPLIWDHMHDRTHSGIDAAARSLYFLQYFQNAMTLVDFGEYSKNTAAAAYMTALVFDGAFQYYQDMAKRYENTKEEFMAIIEITVTAFGFVNGFSKTMGVDLQPGVSVLGIIGKVAVRRSRHGESPNIADKLRTLLNNTILVPSQRGIIVPRLAYRHSLINWPNDDAAIAELKLRKEIGDEFVGNVCLLLHKW
jgi:hypothetical protein